MKNCKSEKYIRVGTTLYKLVYRPLISGDYIEEKIIWSYEALRQDYGKNNLPEIEKYDGFCIIPNHIDYKQIHGTYLNQYEPVNHYPLEGEFPNIRMFLEHIFEEQIELGLDYLQILYTRPTQMLPILLLVSSERGTGKTTFLRFLKMIFGKNATFNTNEDFRSQFNADWANRLLVLVDELLLNKIEDTEKIKNLSTAGDYKIEAKGKDRREIEFFAKFVLCSNNEKNPIIIPKEEIRFWVRKIKTIKNDNIFLREQMAKEIPYFLYYLLQREISTQNESRMWFNPKQLETPALFKIKKYNTNKIEMEMATYCSEVMERLEIDNFTCCPKDFLDVFRSNGLKADIIQIRNIIKDNWQLSSKHKEFKGVINYILDKKKYTEIIDYDDLRLKNKGSIIQSFVRQASMNSRVSKPVCHISLDFSAQDKDKLSNALMVQIARDYMHRMGIMDTQYIIGRHFDKEHPHIHLVFNRVDNSGKTISDSNDRFRSEKICKELTEKYGLFFSSGKENVKRHRLKEPDITRYLINDTLELLVPKCKNWEQLISELQKQGIKTEFKFKSNSDEIQGIRFEKGKYSFSGSKIDRQFSFSKIDYQLRQNAINQNIKQTNSFDNSLTSIFETGDSILSVLLNPQEGNGHDNLDYTQRQRLKKKKRKFGRQM